MQHQKVALKTTVTIERFTFDIHQVNMINESGMQCMVYWRAWSIPRNMLGPLYVCEHVHKDPLKIIFLCESGGSAAKQDCYI